MKKNAIVCLLVILFMLAVQLPYTAQTIYKPPEKSREELYQDIFITLLHPNIDKAVSKYYSTLLADAPTVYPYQVDVIKAERTGEYRSFGFLLTLQVTPVVGPHISVGMDQLTFFIASGRVILRDFKHVKTYDLPPHWQHILKSNSNLD